MIQKILSKYLPKRILQNLTPLLWAQSAGLVVLLLLARAAFPDLLWLTILLAVFLVLTLALLIEQNRKALKSRSAAFGLNSAITVVLVVAIVGVVNFLASRYPLKWDVTANKVHTLSDQTVKLVKGLRQPLKAILWAKGGEREKFRPLLDNYKGLSPKFEVENVDPDREPTRARDAGIKKYGTLQLKYGTKESKVEDPTEEKLTNALVKLLKEKTISLCSVTGHGEKSMSGNSADGYEMARKQLGDQSYEVKDLSLVQDTKDGKIPATCDAIVILGPTRAFFPQEIKVLDEFLASGGRAVVAIDLNIKGAEPAPELLTLLEKWQVKAPAGLIVDPLSKMLGSDAAVPIVGTFNKEQAITKDFQTNCYFPFSRPLEPVANASSGLVAQWIAQSSAKSFVVTNIKELASGQAKIDPSKQTATARNVAVAVSGKLKDSKSEQATRLVVFGTSQFATNQWARFGGNADLFLNSVSWILEDESLISIRAKDEGAGRVELSARAGNLIGLLTVLLIPLAIAALGIGVWYYRRRL